ncbi:hypothetical protein CGRA01v4_06016 [Colletotrichum graminicola]|nr:hypothetical protein CGRA01v4_06016 [Colletotrichum graminicola]
MSRLSATSVEPLCDTTQSPPLPPDCCSGRPLQAEDVKHCATATAPRPRDIATESLCPMGGMKGGQIALTTLTEAPGSTAASRC